MKKAYYEGDLILNSLSIEKLMIYLDPKNIKNLAGYEKKLDKNVQDKIDRRNLREY